MNPVNTSLKSALEQLKAKVARRNDPINMSTEEVKATFQHPAAKARAEVERITAPHRDRLPPQALRMYQTLVMTSLYVLRERGAKLIPTQTAVMIPGEAMAYVLGCDVKTMRKYRQHLIDAGLVDCRALYAKDGDDPRHLGLLWAVRTDPEVRKPVRLLYGDFKVKHRDLQADMKSGKTCYRRYKSRFPHTISGLKTVRRNISELLLWALPPLSDSLALLMYGETAPQSHLRDVLEVPGTVHRKRSEAVFKAAMGMARHLSDLKSFEKYASLLWQALRLQVFGGIDLFGVLYNLAEKCAIDAKEGFARKPGALFIDRLKRSGHYETLQNQPRVPIM